jgi:hypothetical protein
MPHQPIVSTTTASTQVHPSCDAPDCTICRGPECTSCHTPAGQPHTDYCPTRWSHYEHPDPGRWEAPEA